MTAFKLRRACAFFRGGVLLCAIGAAMLPRAVEAQWGSPHSALREDHRAYRAIGALRQRGWLVGSGLFNPTAVRARTRLELAWVAGELLGEVDARAYGLDYSAPTSGPRQRLDPGAISAADLEELRARQAQLLEDVPIVREVVLELRDELNGCGVDARASLLRLDAVERRLGRLESAIKRLSTEFSWRLRMNEQLRRCGIAES